MPDLQLYTLVVPSASQSQLGNLQRQELAQSAILGEDGGVVEPVSSNPADQTLNGVYRGQFAEKMATELDELSSASGFDTVALAGMDGSTPIDGYYAVDEANIEPAQAQTGRAQRFELSLAREGTRNKHWRAVGSNPYKTDHEFGNDLEALVGLPAKARKVQWFHPENQTRAPAMSIETRSAELGDVDIYDLTDASWYDPPPFDEGVPPTLLYDISYTAEENVDCRVYDTRGHDTKLDTDGNLQWQKLFSTQHDIDNPIVMDNGLLRLWLDEAAGTLKAEEWDSGTDSWADVSLTQPASIELFDVDLTSVAMVRDKAQLTFDVDGELFALNAIVTRGAEDVLFTIPENETGPISEGLEGWLGPIASESVVDPNASKTLVSRNEVQR
ncbi:hypothetical protein [Natronorubrum halophilum]|uniref:hypothetical protein n=1 Tax=Natronorubrum halophilum TaxID=1702106 RepID=UPI0010C1F85D|nr:hypothetical protein [Natronorubrum halophilum]